MMMTVETSAENDDDDEDDDDDDGYGEDTKKTSEGEATITH